MEIKKEKLGRRGQSVVQNLTFLFLFLCAIIFLIPLVWIFFTSFKVEREVGQAGGFLFFPKTWTLDNYAELLSPNNTQFPIYKWFSNSLLISSIHTLLAVLIYSMSAFAYAKMRFKGRDVIFLTLFFMSSFPQIVNFIPLYKIMLNLGWLNKAMALIFPGLAGMFNIFLIRQFMYNIPDALIESARIDGANSIVTLFAIIIPLCRPILIIAGLFVFTANWNDFLWPTIAVNNVEKLTLTAGLQLIKGAYTFKASLMMTAAVIAIVPMIVLFLFSHKYLMKGIQVSSGVKG